MLADDLLASRELSFLGAGRDDLIRDLREAHRFDLDAEFVSAADAIGTSRPSAFENALALCRLPYPLTWFETSNVHRQRFSLPSDPSRPKIHRIGCLISSGTNKTGWIAHLAWSFVSGEVNLCPMAVGFDFSGERRFKEIWTHINREKQISKMREVRDPWAEFPAEVDATIRFAERTMPIPSMYHLRAVQGRGVAGMAEAGRHMLSVGESDWESEQPFWLGVLALLNSRNASEVAEGPDLYKLNKSRRKRGQTDLLTYSTCRIAPKLRARLQGAQRQAELGGVRAHFVRGHFKVRSSGVFWWAPFLRGDKRLGFADKDYHVVGRGSAP